MARVNNQRAIVMAMSYRPGTARRRLKALLEELLREYGGKETRGSQMRVVERTGLEQSGLSRALNVSGRSPDLLAYETVVVNLKLRWDYFFGPVEPRSYRDFVGQRYQSLTEFLATEERAAKPDERYFLSSVAVAGGAPDASTYRALLAAYRGTYGRRATEQIVDVSHETIDAAVDDLIPRGDGGQRPPRRTI